MTGWSNLGKTAFSTIDALLFQKTCNSKLVANDDEVVSVETTVHMQKNLETTILR
jgi:hypothetical protein